MASIFLPERFATLKRTVADGIEAAALARSPSTRWLVALDAAKDALATLGAVCPPSASERKEIEGGASLIPIDASPLHHRG